MRSNDSKLVVIGIVLIVLTFLFCQESPNPASSVSTTHSTVPSPHVATTADLPRLSPTIVKKKIDDVLAGRTITFQTSSAVILPEGLATLDQIAPLLQQNHTAAFEIGGHTDNAGAEDKNLALSESRAHAVMDYLVSKGVAANRLMAKGYGASRPITNNATAEGRSRNRRIEFLVRVKGEQP